MKNYEWKSDYFEYALNTDVVKVRASVLTIKKKATSGISYFDGFPAHSLQHPQKKVNIISSCSIMTWL